jgi:hypothetical protein
MVQYRRTILLDAQISVKSNEEWHSKGIPLRPSDIVTVEARAPGRFFATFVPRDVYYKVVGSAAGAYPFELWSDRRGFTVRFAINEVDNWFLVFRVSFFQPDTTISAKIERLRPVD